jgi:hypothetical protein
MLKWMQNNEDLALDLESLKGERLDIWQYPT